MGEPSLSTRDFRVDEVSFGVGGSGRKKKKLGPLKRCSSTEERLPREEAKAARQPGLHRSPTLTSSIPTAASFDARATQSRGWGNTRRDEGLNGSRLLGRGGWGGARGGRRGEKPKDAGLKQTA